MCRYVCDLQLQCSKAVCNRIHGKFDTAQVAHYVKTEQHMAGMQACSFQIRGCCPNKSECTFRHFSALLPLSAEQRKEIDATVASHEKFVANQSCPIPKTVKKKVVFSTTPSTITVGQNNKEVHRKALQAAIRVLLESKSNVLVNDLVLDMHLTPWFSEFQKEFPSMQDFLKLYSKVFQCNGNNVSLSQNAGCIAKNLYSSSAHNK
jgi:hypothetical protein